MIKIFILISLIGFSQFTLARPSIVERCQTQMSSYSQVTICSHEDYSSSDNYGYTIYYRNGLLNSSSQVLVGGIIRDGNYSANLYAGTSSYSNKQLNLGKDRSGMIYIPGIGKRHLRVEVYFQIANGIYDSQYVHNYVFQF